jgi:hypothetical protein
MGFKPMEKPQHYYQLLKGVCLQSHGFQPMGKPQHHYRAEGTEETAIAHKIKRQTKLYTMQETASPTGPEQGHQATTPKAGTTMTPATGTPPPKTVT